MNNSNCNKSARRISIALLLMLFVVGCGYQPRAKSVGSHPINGYNLIYRSPEPGWGWDVVQEWMVEKGFRVIRDSEAESMLITDRMKMLIPQIAVVSSTMASSTVRVRLLDALSLETVIEAEGRNGMGMSIEGDQRNAFNRAMNTITAHYVAYKEMPRKVPTLDKTDFTRTTFEQLLQSDGADLFEGVYTMDQEAYVIGIINRSRTKIASTTKKYIGIVLETKNPLYAIGELKLAFSPSARGTDLFMEYYNVTKVAHTVTAKANGDEIKGEIAWAGKKLPVSLVKMDIGSASKRGGTVAGSTAMGSCFQILDNGTVITNYHVIDGAKRIEVLVDGKAAAARLLYFDSRNDLAALQVEALSGNGRVMPMGKASDIVFGKRVFTMGFPAPDSLGTSIKYSEGTISGMNGHKDATNIFQLDAPVHPGNSGGPVMSEDGCLIGVIVSRINDAYFFENTGSIAQNINYAIKVGYLKAFLEAQGVEMPAALNLGGGERNAVIQAVTPMCHLILAHFD